MYFSKNSRYVLKKAQIFSPTLFKTTEKNLSVKTPKDDPSKPSLRVNIPKDPSEEENYSKAIHNGEARESRSRSYTSGPRSSGISATFQDDLLKKCESEIHFPSFVTDDILINNELDSATKTPLESGLKRMKLGVGKKDDYNDGLRTALHDETTERALGNNYLDKESLIKSEMKEQKKEASSDDTDPKSLYIIIDVPDVPSKSLDANLESATEASNACDSTKEKESRSKESIFFRASRSMQKFPFLRGKPENTKKFEINEIEEAATYVFHFKLNNKIRNKPSLGCVPEKEVTTRNENSVEPSIKVTDAVNKTPSTTNPRRRQVASIEEFPSIIRYPDATKKFKFRRIEFSKANTSTPNISSPQDSEQKPVEDLEDSSQKYMHQNVHSIKDDRISPPKFERDDFGTIRSSNKNYPFRLPQKIDEKTQSAASLGEASGLELNPEFQTAEDFPNAVTAENKTEFSDPSQLQSATPGGKSVENASPFYGIYGESHEKSIHDEGRRPKKKLSESSTNSKPDNEPVNFQTTSNSVSIGCEKISGGSMKFCAAFPPLLGEALKNRFKFRKDFYFNEKLDIPLKSSRSFEESSNSSSKVNHLLENSILFPKKDAEKFDCESLFTTREEVILNIIKNSEEEKASATSEKIVKATGEGSTENSGKTSVDSLSVMKKVKEIVQFDLDNVVKIYSDGDSNSTKDISSVVMAKEDGWEINAEELTKQREASAIRMQCSPDRNDMKHDVFGDKRSEIYHPIKYLPSTRETSTEMKLSREEESVVFYNPQTNEFFINKDTLAEVIARKTNEPISEVSKTLSLLASQIEAKSGDSILVFDDETQSWKVDFTILERREQQLKIEEELTKRSELILETFEKLENGQMSTVSFPKTREKKTFDYKNEKWNAYNSDKKSKEKSTKSKCPFKEPDAEEIRKKNSDLYENLFVANKKENGKARKMVPGLETRKTPKKSKSMLLADKPHSGGSQKESNPANPPGPEPPKPGSKIPPEEKKEKPIPRKEDHFWESFLNMNILPRDYRDIPKIPPPTPELPKIEEPLPEISQKKIEESKFKIRIPFIKDKKNEKPTDASQVPKKDSKIADEPAEPTSEVEKPRLKAPPPSSSGVKHEEPNKKPPPTIGSSKNSSTKPEVKNPSGSSNSKVQEPKTPSGGKNDKMASAPDHYVSDKIIEISRNKGADNQTKLKANKIETVKLNITTDKRLPSKVTEINLSKKAEEKAKETTATQQNPVDAKTPPDSAVKKDEQSTIEKKTFPKNFEKYKTPFSEPDYEEKSLKIKSDIESNPNLKKLDNWSKTLVLHDIMKPPENIESWLKDETDKMATLLLKVLQEAADGKPKKKQALNKSKNEKQVGKANPYDNIRKKQETTPENFLFRVRTVNLSLDNDKKLKSGANMKLTIKSDQMKDMPVQSEKTVKAQKMLDESKLHKELAEKDPQVPITMEDTRYKSAQTALETSMESAVMSREFSQRSQLPLEITEEIPGPEILKKISNTWKVFPILGSQMTIFTLLRVFQLVNLGSSILGSSNPDKSRRHAFTKLFLKYGPIVNVQGPLSGNVILIHTPEHLTGVFEQDITTNVRSVFDSLENSRRDAEESGLSVGLATDWSKPEWNDLKKGTTDPISRGNSKYFGLCDAAGDSLVSNVRKNRNAQNFVSEDFMEEIRRWSLEGLCSVIFEKSFGFLEGRTTNWIMEPDKLYLAVDEATRCLSKCERGFQMWRLMATPSSMGLSHAYRTISSILSKQLYQAEINLKGKSELLKNGSSLPVRDLTFIESMLLNDGMTTEEVTCNLIDVIVVGTNAMNSALGFLLYNLAQNVKVQMKLLKELKEVLPNKDSALSYNKLASLKYLQACLKETLRLHFPVPVFYRLLQNDILLANYIVPKGTFVVMDYRVSSMKEQVFDDPDKFIPERWMQEEHWIQSIHPFGAFPLCHGPRADLAKKVVEMQLSACIAKLIRNFHVEYQYGEIQGTDAIISVPDKPLKLSFAEREL